MRTITQVLLFQHLSLHIGGNRHLGAAAAVRVDAVAVAVVVCRADMHVCEWKDDCQQCSKMTYNRDCVSRDFCVWDQGTLPKHPHRNINCILLRSPV